MDRSNALLQQSIETIRSTLRPFDPANTDESPEYLQWFAYFGIYRRPVALGTIPAGEYEISVYYTAPENPIATVLFISGFLDHGAIHGKLINDLLDHRYAVITADLPGHGFSSGDRGTIADFRTYGTMAKELVALHTRFSLPGNLHLIGHSTGGAAILELLRTEGKIWSGSTVLVAPLIRSPLWRLSTAGTILADRSNIKMTPRVFQTTSHDTDFLRFLRGEPHCIGTFVVEWSLSLANWVPLIEVADFPDIPVTVIQGTDDFTVGWRTNMKTIGAKFPRADILMISGGRHHLLNESDLYRTPVYEKIHATLSGENQ